MVLSLPHGATHAVNYKTQDFAEEVKKITNGKGVDVIIDVVGQSHWHKNIDSLAFDGRMTLLATLSGEIIDSSTLACSLTGRISTARQVMKYPSSASGRYCISASVSRVPRCVLARRTTRLSSLRGMSRSIR